MITTLRLTVSYGTWKEALLNLMGGSEMENGHRKPPVAMERREGSSCLHPSTIKSKCSVLIKNTE